MDGVSASPNGSCAMQLQAEHPAPAQEGAICHQHLLSSTNTIGGCGRKGEEKGELGQAVLTVLSNKFQVTLLEQ